MLFISNPRIQLSEEQFACRDCDKKFNVAICALSNSHWWKAVRLSWMWQENRMYIGYMMLHHRIQTDLKAVDAGVQASTSCTSGVDALHVGVDEKLCRLSLSLWIRSYAGGCRLQQAACRMLQPACRLHAGFMQHAYDRTQEVAGCSILHAECSRLHAACMQPACILHASLVGH